MCFLVLVSVLTDLIDFSLTQGERTARAVMFSASMSANGEGLIIAVACSWWFSVASRRRGGEQRSLWPFGARMGSAIEARDFSGMSYT